MKKVVFLAMMAVLFTACKKDWTCICGSDETGYAIKNKSKKEAKDLCEGKVSFGLVSVGGNNCSISKD